MRFEIGFHFERDAFSTMGPTPHLSVWATFGGRPGAIMRSELGKTLGFKIGFGIRPLRLAWNGVWKYGYHEDQ